MLILEVERGIGRAVQQDVYLPTLVLAGGGGLAL